MILPENEATEFENRTYVNPQLVVDEGESFIDKLRSTQQANNQQIKTQTYNLGTAVPSNLGGLVGGEGYWTSRYQTPQTISLANDLRAANRAAALNQAMQNDIAAWKKRYADAKRAYELSQNGGNNNDDTTEGEVKYEDNTQFEIEGEVPGIEGVEGHVVGNFIPNWDNPEESYVTGYTLVPEGEDGKTNITTSVFPEHNKIEDLSPYNPKVKTSGFGWSSYVGQDITLPSGKQVLLPAGSSLYQDQWGGYYINKNSYGGNNEYEYIGK